MNNYKQENRERGPRSSLPLVLFTSRSRSLPLLVRMQFAAGNEFAK